jgi:hypothetical protein
MGPKMESGRDGAPSTIEPSQRASTVYWEPRAPQAPRLHPCHHLRPIRRPGRPLVGRQRACQAGIEPNGQVCGIL